MIDVQRFSVLRSPTLAPQAVGLIRRNKRWLDDYRPGVTDGYRDVPHAAKRIARVGLAEDLDGYLIRKDRTAIGIATLIKDRRIDVQTKAGPVQVTGTDMDYWLDREATLDIYGPNEGKMIVDALLTAAHARKTRTIVFAALKPEELRRAPGIAESFEAVGQVEPISVSEADPYDIAKGGASLQVFATPRRDMWDI